MNLIQLALAHVFDPHFVALTFSIGIFERILPVNPEQRPIGRGLLHDSFYIFLAPAVWMASDLLIFNFLAILYNNHLGHLKMRSLAGLPLIIQFIILALLTDFLMWFNHWLRHRIPILWEFHKVHHAQTELNQFTDMRGHLIEVIIIKFFLSIPLLLLETQHVDVMWYTLFTTFVTRLSHANVRSNLGMLRFVFVGPQAHRIHHSYRPEHQGKNFGVVFSFWDGLFGTQYRNYSEYPETGLKDRSFPNIHGKTPWSFLLTPMVHFLYPFKILLIEGRHAHEKNEVREGVQES